MATLEQTLLQVRTALSNAMENPQLLSMLSLYGYGVERLQEGMILWDTAANLLQSQNDTRFNKATAKKNFQEHWLDAKFHLQRDLHIARFVFRKDDAMYSLLQLNGNFSKDFDTWYQHTKKFYFGLRNKPELQAAVASKGLTPDRIEQGIERLAQLEADRRATQAQKGNSSDSRTQRIEAFQALKRWMIKFRTVARVAFDEQPNLLASLGIPTPSSKPKKKSSIVILPAAQPTAETSSGVGVIRSA